MTDHTQELHADARAHFMATMGFEHVVDDHAASGSATVGDYLHTAAGWPGAAALLTFADVLIGRLASHRTAPRISVTADLSVWILGSLPADGRLEMSAGLIKTGQSMSVGETRFTAAGSGEFVATAIGTFLASPRPGDLVPERFAAMARAALEPVGPTAPTLIKQVGLEVVGPGVAEIRLRPDLVNATQALQGGLVALLGEVAAQSAATEAAGRPHVVDSLEVHYLAAARVGPFRASARLLAGEGGGAAGAGGALVRVEVRDLGRDDRLVSVIVATTRVHAG